MRNTRLALIALAMTFATSTVAEAGSLWDRIFAPRKRTEVTKAVLGSGARIPTAVPSSLQQIFEEAAASTGLDPNLIAAVAYQESRFDQRAVSSRGAQGLMQLMPRTAAYVGVRDPFDARQNVLGGAKYLAEMFDTFDGDLELSLAAYNAGPTAVKKKGPGATQEAVHYVAAVKSFYRPTQNRPWLGLASTTIASR
ncbi:MAG TPA: lytic transglycosylase domain-containing protein [Thermoanaerobaculia bacterium]|nr:lytic transglycosylase domain-containing protein [Thermoanaerobaculia bacterium]